MMKVTYIHHSGFLVELSDCILLFDYYKGDLPELTAGKPLLIFASHRHYDHYNDKIFKLQQAGQELQYILSWDITIPTCWEGEMPQVKFMEAHQEYQIEELKLKVETLKSTDEGVAFLVTHPDGVIYHGGDLNWWHWEGEGDEYNQMMAWKYQNEIDKIAGCRIDVAFLPLDPRQEAQFYLGFDYFMRKTMTKQAYPMHCWGKFETIERFRALPVTESYRKAIVGADFFARQQK